MSKISWLHGVVHVTLVRDDRVRVEVEDCAEGVMYRFRGEDEDLQHGDRVTFLPEAKTWRGRPVTRRALPRV